MTITDVPGVRVGHWTDAEARTGCTVVLLPAEGAVAGVDVRGSAPGTRETDLLRPGMLVGALFAFLSSFNEAVVALFIAGRGAATLPKKMYESIRLESDPVIAVVSTLLVSVVVLGVLVSVFMRGRTSLACHTPALAFSQL